MQESGKATKRPDRLAPNLADIRVFLGAQKMKCTIEIIMLQLSRAKPA